MDCRWLGSGKRESHDLVGSSTLHVWVGCCAERLSLSLSLSLSLAAACRDSGWKPYSQEQAAQIEQAFMISDGKGEHMLEGGSYAIDFVHMRQVNASDRRRSRAVRRLEKQA